MPKGLTKGFRRVSLRERLKVEEKGERVRCHGIIIPRDRDIKECVGRVARLAIRRGSAKVGFKRCPKTKGLERGLRRVRRRI